MTRALIIPSLAFLAICQGLPNYKNTELHQCIKCFCHAISNCNSRLNCAAYSISFDYWKTAQGPRVDDSDTPNAESSYRKCIKNENCILATISQYADSISHMDCNCDGSFDCKDRYAIHIYGNQCGNPKFPHDNATRFNTCAMGRIHVGPMLDEEGDGCSPEVFI